MKDHRRLLSGLLAAVMVMSQTTAVLAAESVNAVPAADGADQAVAADSLEAYGFPGGYEPDAEAMELKADMAANGMVAALEESVEGRDYREGKIWFLADDREDAEAIAGSYGATLINFSYGVGTAELNGGKTVLDAVTAAADTGSQLPPVEPVYISELEPDVGKDGNDDLDAAGASVTVDPALTWKDYICGNNSKEDDPGYQKPILDNPDPLLTDPSNLEDSKTQYQYQHDQVNTWEAWGSSIGSSDVKVAVVDTGVFAGHEDFIDPDSGKSIVVKAVDVTKSKAGEVTGEHGTHVAGIIGALVNNGKGGAGIAPGVSIYSYNIAYCYEGRMENDDIARGISAAMGKDENGKMVEEPADIINMSFGGTKYSASECALIKQAYEDGICVYAAAGNNFTNVRCYPAAFTSTKDTGIVSVGSTDYNGKKASYSNFGPWVTVCAPGTAIRSTVPSFKGKDNKPAYEYTKGDETYHVFPLDTLSNNCYETMSGTSMAAPVVSGVAALYLSAYGPSLGGSKVLVGRDLPKKMKELLLSGGTEVKDLGKRVNVGTMFGKESKNPAIVAYDDEYNPVPKDKPNKNIYRDVYYVALSSKATLSSNRIETSSVKYNTWDKEKIYYTVDGDEPKVDPATLTVTSGTLYEPGKYLAIQNFKPGSKHTIRALAVTSAKKVTGVSSITVYAPEIQKKTMNPTVKKIDLFAESTADAKKDRDKGKKSVIYFSDGVFGPYSATATGSAGDELQAASSSLFFDQIKPTLTFTNGTVAGVGDFTEDQLDCMIWGSNNGSVLTVIPNPDGSCTVFPVKKGNCKVNLWVYSNGKVQKSKDISVTVKQAIDEINIKGLSSIDPGSGSKTITTTYKAECLPKEASEKKVLWHLMGGVPEYKQSSSVDAAGRAYSQEINIGGGKVEINEKNGKLKMTGVKVNPSYPDSFAVVAVSADTQLVREYKEVVIGNKTDESLKIGLKESELTYYQKFVEKKKDRVVYNKKNTCLKSFVLASADLPGEGNDNCVTLYSTDGVPVDWSSSDKNIARVDALPGSLSANVYGMKSGSATIRCKAADGSGKSVSITVNVKNPVSGLEVGEDNFTDFYTLAVGKTVTPPSYVGKTYGTPSNSTLTWGFSAGYVKADKEKGKVVLQDVDKDLTAELHGSSSGVSVNEKTGKLTINKSKWSSAYNDRVYIRVYAYTTDGTEYSDYTNYVITTPVTGITMINAEGQTMNKGTVITMEKSGSRTPLYLVLDGQGSNNENLQFGRISVTSSKSECGGAEIVRTIDYDKNLGRFVMTIRAWGGEVKGTATINIKALDGSGKTTSFKIKTENSVKITKW